MPRTNNCPTNMTFIGHPRILMLGGTLVVNGTRRQASPMTTEELRTKLAATWHRLQDIVSQVRGSGDTDRTARALELLEQGRSLQEDGKETVPLDEQLKRLEQLKRSAAALLPKDRHYTSRTTTVSYATCSYVSYASCASCASYVSRDGRPLERVDKGAAFSDSNGRFFAPQVFNEAPRSPRADANPAPVAVEVPIVIRPRAPEAASTPCAAALPVAPDEEWTMLDLDPQEALPPSAAPRRNAARRLLDRVSNGLRSMFAREHERGGDDRRLDGLRMQRT